MSISEKLKALMKEKGIKTYRLAKETGISYTGLLNIVNGSTKNPSIDSLATIAKYFNIDVGYFTNEDFMIAEDSAPYNLNRKEENDIADELERMMQQLDSDSAISFHGEKIEMNEDEKELLRISFENSLRVAKQIAKKKFNPNKKKD